MFCLFLILSFAVADLDYLSSKFVENLKYDADIHFYNQLYICNAGGKTMAIPYNSTHFEMKKFEDSSCKNHINSTYLKGKYFDDIVPILQKAYAYKEESDEKFLHIATYVTYKQRYCNICTENKLWYVDYSDGFFYIQHGTIDANTVVYPTCIPTDPTKSDIFLRCFKGVWRPNIFERTNLGGILAKEEAECDDAEPLALVVVFIIGLLLF